MVKVIGSLEDEVTWNGFVRGTIPSMTAFAVLARRRAMMLVEKIICDCDGCRGLAEAWSWWAGNCDHLSF